MFYALLLVLLVVASFVLVLAILSQAGKGGGLAANFGGAGSSSDSFLGSRQASTLLTKSSWYAGAVFLGLSYILSLASTRPDATSSVLDAIQSPPPATIPLPTGGDATGGGLLVNPPVTGDTGSGGAGKVPPL